LQGLAGQHDVVAVAEHEDLGGTPDDLFEVHHGAHLEPILPQEQVLKEIPGQAPGPERQVPIADGGKAEPPQLEHQDVGAEEIIAPILEKRRDVLKVLLAAAEVERAGRADEQAAARLEHAPATLEPGVDVLGIADRFERVDRIEAGIRELQAVEVLDHDPQPAVVFLKFQPANVALHGRVGHTGDIDLATGGEIVGGSTRAASQIQQAHPVLGREQQIIGRVTIGERRAREDAGAVVVMLAAIGAEHVVICAMLVVMLEQIVRLRHPLDQLAPLELVERTTDPAGVPGMRGQHKEDVMKQDAGCQDSADDQPDYRDDLQLDSPVKFGSPARVAACRPPSSGGSIVSAHTSALIGAEPGIRSIATVHNQCPLWVKSRHVRCTSSCPLCPQ